MIRRTRAYVAGLLLLTYGGVALIGSGLHALIPCNDGRVETVSTQHCSHNHDHEQGHQAAAAAAGYAHEQHFATPPDRAHDAACCDVCALLAQAKGPWSSAGGELCQPASLPFDAVVSVLNVSKPHHEPYTARGPPVWLV